MSENTEPQATTPETEYSAADAVAELAADPGDEQQEDKPSPEEPKSDDPTADEVDSEDEGDDEEDEEEDSSHLPDLDNEIAKLSPELKKRWEQQWKGVVKRESRLQEAEKRFEALASYEQAFADRATAAEAVRSLAEQLAKIHGQDVAEYLGGPEAAQQTYSEGDEPWVREGFQYEGEWKAYRRAKEEAKRELADTYGLDQELIRDLKEERERAKSAREMDAYLDKNTSKVVNTLRVQEDGWPVTRDMVAEAVKNLPQFKEKPADAVRMWFAKDLAKHARAKAAAAYKKTPEMFDSATSRGMDLPTDPMEYRAIHAMAELSD
jgi:hypothetical protein